MEKKDSRDREREPEEYNFNYEANLDNFDY